LNVLWKREECPLRRALEQNLVTGHYASPAFRRISS
jgi:hypothetical protein